MSNDAQQANCDHICYCTKCVLLGMMLQCHLETQNLCGNTLDFLSLAASYCLCPVVAQVLFSQEATHGSLQSHLHACSGHGVKEALLSTATVTRARDFVLTKMNEIWLNEISAQPGVASGLVPWLTTVLIISSFIPVLHLQDLCLQSLQTFPVFSQHVTAQAWCFCIRLMEDPFLLQLSSPH